MADGEKTGWARLKARIEELVEEAKKAAREAEEAAKREDEEDEDEEEDDAEAGTDDGDGDSGKTVSPASKAIGAGVVFAVSAIPIVFRGGEDPGLFARFFFVVMSAQFFWQLHKWRVWREENE